MGKITKLQLRSRDVYNESSIVENVRERLTGLGRSHVDRVLGAAEILYKKGETLDSEDMYTINELLDVSGKYISERSDKIVNSSYALQLIDEMKTGLDYSAERSDVEAGSIGGLEKQVRLVPNEKVVDNGRLKTRIPVWDTLNRAAGVAVQTLKYLGCTAGGVAIGFLGKGVLDNYNADKAALEAFVRPNATVVNTVSAQEISKQNESPVKYTVIDADPLVSSVKDVAIVSVAQKKFEVENSPTVNVNYASNCSDIIVNDIESIEKSEVKRPGYYDYNFGQHPDARKVVADEKWKDGDKLGGAVTRAESGVAYVNDIVEFGVVRPVVGTVGGLSRTVEKARLLENVLNFVGIKKPLREARAKDNPNENVFAVGYLGGEDVAAFVMDGTVGGEGFDGLHADVVTLHPVKGLKRLYGREASTFNGHLKLAEIAAHYIFPWNWGGDKSNSGSGSGLTRTGGGENAGGLTRQ